MITVFPPGQVPLYSEMPPRAACFALALKAAIHHLTGCSAHADQNTLAACLETCELRWSVNILMIPFDFLENPMALRKMTTQARNKNFRIQPRMMTRSKQV